MKRNPEIGKKPIHNARLEARLGRNDIVHWDVFPVRDGERLRLVFESKNSPWRQGVRLATDIDIAIPSAPFDRPAVKKGAGKIIFQDNTTDVEIVCHTKDGRLSLYNIWDAGNDRKLFSSLGPTAGMLVEELPNGRRYRCNDSDDDRPAFDNVVFRIERIPS